MVREIGMIDLHYLVFFKRGNKSSNRFFIVTQIRRDEFINPAVFHGIGFFTEKKVVKEITNQIIEVWIPWSEIDHIESLMYRQKN